MRPSDIERLVAAGAPSVHPSGDRVVAAVGHPDLGSDADVAQLWEFPLPSGTARQLTRGVGDGAPRFSPDGRMLAFLRGTDRGPQLHVLDARGGEPRLLTDRRLGVEELVWSPDSRTIVIASRDPETGRYGSVDGLGPDAEPPRRITTVAWNRNGLGWEGDRPRRLYAVPVPEPDDEPAYRAAPEPGGGRDPDRDGPPGLPVARPLTPGDADAGSAFFSPDGAAVWFVSRRHPDRDRDLRTDLYRVPLAPDADGAPEGMTVDGPPRDVTDGGFGADGALWVIAGELGADGMGFLGTHYGLFRDASGTGGDLVRLTDAETLQVGGTGGSFRIDAAGRTLVILTERGRHVLAAVAADGTLERLTRDDAMIDAADAAGGRIVAVARTAARPGELLLVGEDPTADHGWISDVGARLDSIGLVRPIEEEHPSADGYPVHGWVAIPDGPGPHPVLLTIHGGPFGYYGIGLLDETQVLVSAGYAVAYCNPRGSLGYGQAHGRAIRERMGTVDLDDVLAFLDGTVAAHPELDGTRTGVLGASYGGYLTAWAIAHDPRFAAAVVERAFLDPETFIGTSDIGWYYSDSFLGSDPAHRATQSAQAVVDRVRTPTLVLYAEDDLRCPLSQGTRYYIALKRNGVETELLVFPGENHGLSHTGRPRHRVQRFDALLDWFGRHLPVGRTSKGVDSDAAV